MTISYDVIGVLLGDTSHTLLGTASIYALSTIVGENTYTLAAASARSIAATFAGSVTKRAGDVSINASDKYKHYSDLAKQLESKAQIMALGSGGAYAGGISKSDKAPREQNTDRAQPKFTRDLHRDPSLDDTSDYSDLT